VAAAALLVLSGGVVVVGVSRLAQALQADEPVPMASSTTR
jgi:hypothetical protein